MNSKGTSSTLESFEDRLRRVDLGLWDYVESQTTEADRRTLTGIHAACREANESFAYLEIGSHVGGSMQTYVADSRCSRIVSIDPRKVSQPDERGRRFDYPANSCQAMLERLRHVPGADIGKIRTLEASTSELAPSAIEVRPIVNFVDGEHTDEAALRDAMFCLAVSDPNGCIVFHDAHIIYRALRQFLAHLRAKGRQFRAHIFPDSVFMIELGECSVAQSRYLASSRELAFQAYLYGLNENDVFREYFRRPFTMRWKGFLSRFAKHRD